MQVSKQTVEKRGSTVGEDAGQGIEGTIPKGQIDPVYEAKARVLNRAVSCTAQTRTQVAEHRTDSRYRYGLVSMATLRGRWLRLG